MKKHQNHPKIRINFLIFDKIFIKNGKRLKKIQSGSCRSWQRQAKNALQNDHKVHTSKGTASIAMLAYEAN
jgi:hypothetical protein